MSRILPILATVAVALAIIGVAYTAMQQWRGKGAEGFADGAVPVASDSAAPGATTPDPTRSLAQAVDLQAATESIGIFNAMLTHFKTHTDMQLPQQKETEIKAATEAATAFLAKTNGQRAAMQLADVQRLRADVEAATNTLRGIVGTDSAAPLMAATATAPALPPIAVAAADAATAGEGVTFAQLQTLKQRIDAESTRLEALRTNDATTLARITQLQRLSADIAEYMDRVDRGQIKLADVPIRAADATAFLQTVTNTDRPLPSLIAPDARTAAAAPAVATAPFAAMDGAASLQSLLDATRDLSWEFKVRMAHDPAAADRKAALQTLEAIERKLNALATVGGGATAARMTPATAAAIQRELLGVQAVLGSGSDAGAGADAAPAPAQGTRRATSSAEYPTADQVNIAQGKGFGPSGGSTFPHGEVSPDIWIRPGFLMNDATIARRASASAFDPSSVGGADYKQRAADLCRQIKSAQLGDPANFGCIANPEEVSADYSWKGNYQMVCNRIGYTWGAWYPEMFGCPKQDPSIKYASN